VLVDHEWGRRACDQHLAEQAVAGRLAGAGLGGALVSLDPATGAVVAMVGGRDFASSKVNLATGQGGGGFPPGSSFKVFYLVAALEQGIPASTSFDTASPTTVTGPACPAGHRVHNAEPASPAASPWPRPAPSPSRPTTPS
jgi:membrane peptidoglycan carboxypeptidase